MKSLPSRRFGRFGISRSAGRGASASVVVVDTTPSASQSSVTASPSLIANDGVETSTVTVTVLNASDTPLAGVTVVPSSTGASNTFSPTSGTTDSAGVVTFTYTSTSAATKTISATAGGVSITDTATVTVSASGSGPTMVFASQWNSATGDTNAAVQDTSASTPWEFRIGAAGRGMQVVNAASEGVDTGCPTTNCLRVDLIYAGGGVQNMYTDQVSNLPGGGAWTVPAVGESVYFRSYKRLAYPHGSDPGTLGNNNHCLEQQSGGSTDWSWNFNTASGGWQPSFNLWNGGAATRYRLGGSGSPTYLTRDVWYRLEWRMHRTGTTTYEFEVRIYDNTGTLVYDDGDLLDDLSSPLTGVSKTITDINDADAFQLGTNGPHVVGATQGAAPAWYFAATAVSKEDWCGPFISGEAP